MSSNNEMDNLVAEGRYESDDDDAPARRMQSSIQFPYNDLDDAAKIASTIWSRYPRGCDLGQLAGAYHSTIKSGAFRTKVLAAKMFGFVQGTQTLALTNLGRKVVDDRSAAEAKAEAFLSVPLFKAIYDDVTPSGGMLPSSTSGLGHLIASLGVVQTQVDKARQVFTRSAKQAGFLDHGDDRLVMPALDTRPVATEEPIAKEPATPTVTPETEVQQHPLLVGLLRSLPAPGQPFSKAERERWLNALSVNFDFIYGPPEPEKPKQQQQIGVAGDLFKRS